MKPALYFICTGPVFRYISTDIPPCKSHIAPLLTFARFVNKITIEESAARNSQIFVSISRFYDQFCEIGQAFSR